MNHDDVPRDLYVLIADHAEPPNKATPIAISIIRILARSSLAKVISALEHPPWSLAQRRPDVPGANRR